MKGFIFSIDAMLGMAVIVAFISGMYIISLSEPSLGIEQSILYTNATESAFTEFYSGGTDLDPAPISLEAYCKEIYDYRTNGDVFVKVRKCSQLG